MRRLLFIVNDNREKHFGYRTYDGYRRLVHHGRIAGFEVYLSGWDSLLVREDGVYVKRGMIVDPQGREDPIEEPIRCYPDYIWDGAVHEPVRIDQENLEVFKYLLRHKIVMNMRAGNNALGLRDIRVTEANVEKVCEFLDGGLLPELHVGTHSIAVRYIHHLRQGFWRRSLSSRSFLFTTLGKFQLESYLKIREANGGPEEVCVRRPWTFRADSRSGAAEGIRRLVEEDGIEYVIAKPSAGTRLEGILLITRNNLEERIREVLESPGEQIVVQKYIADSVHYEGRKADIRIYVGVFSWDPLVYRVYRNGMTRVTSQPFTLNRFEEVDNSLTTRKCYYTLQDYFASSFESPESAIWEEIERTVAGTLNALLESGQSRELLLGVIPYLGFDILLREDEGKVQSWLLEVNHAPMLYTDKRPWEHAVNQLLDRTHAEFFQDVMTFISTGHLSP